MADHVKPGGCLIVEPWFTPANWHPNTVHASYINEPELKIVRMNTSSVRNKVSIFDLHHLIGTPKRTEYIVEHHELGLFEISEMKSAMKDAGLSVRYDSQGLTGRGLYIGKRKQ
jgi:hypothetical protein